MDNFDGLFQQALDLGICEKYREQWVQAHDLPSLCHYFHYGQDFCIKHNFPSVEFLEKYQGQIEQFGIYTGSGNSIDQREVVALGNANINVVATAATSITVRHNATVHVQVFGKTLCYISAHDNCKVIIDHRDLNSRVCMSYWGGNIVNKEQFDKITYK